VGSPELSGTDDTDDEDSSNRHRAYFIFYIFSLFEIYNDGPTPHINKRINPLVLPDGEPNCRLESIKPSQGSVPAGLTLASDLAFVSNASRVRPKCCVDPLRPPRLSGTWESVSTRGRLM
jgi:hypothetical protein